MATKNPIEWLEKLPCSVTVCDRDYTILYMNDRSAEVNAKDGGKALIGRNLMDCHPAPAQEKLTRVMSADQANVYTIEKNGVKKIIFQAHWKQDGEDAGLVEIAFEVPPNTPHFVRT
jgi:transcriptional regulator with PAS, ATPase and Fis domain